MHVQIWTRTGLSIRTKSQPNVDKEQGYKFVSGTLLYGHVALDNILRKKNFI